MKKKLFTLLTLLLCLCSGAWAYEGASGDVTFSKVNSGGKAKKLADGCYAYRASSGYNWTDNNGIKTQSNTGGIIVFYISESSNVTVDIKHTESKNAHNVTASFYTLTESAYSAFYGITSETAVTFSLPTTASYTKTISVSATSETFTGTQQLDAGYYAVVCNGEKGNTYHNAIHFATADSRPAAPISWSASSANGEVGGSTASLPTLTNESGLTVTYSSSNTSVATIGENTGEVTFVSGGVTTISATYTSPNAQATYKTTTVSYTLNIALVAQNNKTWKTSDFVTSFGLTGSASKAITGSEYVSNLEIKGTSSTAITVTADGSEQTIDNENVGTGRTKLGKNGTSDGNYLHFKVKPYTSITFYGIRSSSGKESNAIAMSFGTFGTDEIKKTFDTSSGKGSLTKIYTGTVDTDVYAYSGNSNGASAMEIKVTPLSIGAPTFSAPAGEVSEGSTITVTSEYATTIKYKWTASSDTPTDGWLDAVATDGAADITVPDYDAVTPANNAQYLHVYGYNGVIADGEKASRAYTITAADTDAPEFVSSSPANNATGVAVEGTIVLTFNEAIGSVDASKFTLSKGTKGDVTIDGTDNTKVNVAYSAMPYTTEVTLSVAAEAVADASGNKSAALSDIKFTTTKPTLAKPTITGRGYFIGSQTVTITSIEGATITYSENGTDYSAYPAGGITINASKTIYAKATHNDYSDSPVNQFAMYQITVPDGQGDVSATTTWGFTNSNDMKPSSEVEYANADIPLTELASTVSIYTDKDKAAQLSFIKPQRYDTDGYVQAHGFIITTTVPGKLSVSFTNGNSNLRYLIVNGNIEGQINSSSTTINATDIDIPIGTTVVYGFDNPSGVVNNLRYKTISFTVPTTVSATVGTNGYTTFATPYALDLTDANRPEGLKAYKATRTGANLTFEKLNQTVPAGTGLLLLGETKGGTYNIPVAASGTAVENNALIGVTSPVAKQSVENDTYYFVMKKAANADDPLKFAPITTTKQVTIPAGKAYIEVPNNELTNARELLISFSDGETTAINGIEEVAPVTKTRKVVKNGRLVIETANGEFTIDGARVK